MMVIHAISKGCRKTILIFNTSTSASSPIYVVKPTHFGGFEDCDIPVILGYNQYHYESLHPLTEEDIDKTKALVESLSFLPASLDDPRVNPGVKQGQPCLTPGSTLGSTRADLAGPQLTLGLSRRNSL